MKPYLMKVGTLNVMLGRWRVPFSQLIEESLQENCHDLAGNLLQGKISVTLEQALYPVAVKIFYPYPDQPTLQILLILQINC